MSVLGLLRSSSSSPRLRMMAASNITAFCFFCSMTLTVTSMTYFKVIPTLWGDQPTTAAKHYLAVIFLFMQTVGHFYLTITTDTSLKFLGDNMVKRKTQKLLRQMRENEAEDKWKDKVVSSKQDDTREQSMDEQASASARAQDKSHADHSNKATRHSNKDTSCSQHKSKTSANNKKQDTSTASTSAQQESPAQTRAAWHMCDECEVAVPARAHHCALCDVCTLKHDHHCFFMCTCIGYTNQRHFILFCVFMSLAGLYAVVLFTVFLKREYHVPFTAASIFTYGRDGVIDLFLRGPDAVPKFCIIFLFYCCLLCGLFAASFAYWQVAIASQGQTTYEATHGIRRHAKSSVSENIRDVLGPNWLYLIFLPISIKYFPECYKVKKRTGSKTTKDKVQRDSSDEECKTRTIRQRTKKRNKK